MFLFSVFCVVLALEFAVTTPQGNRFNESNIQNEANSNEFIPQENQNEDYEKIVPNNNPIAFSNFYKQSNVISEKKEHSHNIEKKFKTLNDDSSSSSYIASLPQVNRFQTFRPKNGVNNEANIPRMGDILSEVNNPNNEFSRIESNPPIIKERTSDNQVLYEYNRPSSQIIENLNEKKEEENGTEFDVPVATPEYIKSLLNEYKHTQNSNVKSIITNSPRNDINIKNFQRNSQNMNEATFQNPSAEILYETGKAKPYEISNEQLFNSRRGNKHRENNILHDKQKLKNLYLSSKPTKHYMIVYPDGRVEEVDRLDKIKKMHPNYVMLNAKELLQHGEANKKVSTESQESRMKQNLSNISATMIPLLNTIKDTKDNQIDKVPQTVDAQSVPVPIDRFSNVTEHDIISTANITKTNNVAKTSKDEVLITSTTGNNIQKQLQENGINDSQEKNDININENTNSGSIVKTSDISNIPVKANKDIEDNATTVRSTKSIPTDDTDILNQNISKSLATSNNTDKPKLSKEQKNINNTSGSNFQYTKYESVIADTSNSSASLETYREESNSFSKLNNKTMITFEDGKDRNTETIISNNNYENNAQNLGSNIVTSYDNSTMSVTTTNKIDIANTSSDDIQDNAKPFNVNYSNSLRNKTLVINENYENNVNTTTIQTESNVTNSGVDDNKNDDNNLKPYPSDIYSDATYKNASSSNTPDAAYDVNNTQDESNLIKILKENVKKYGSKHADDDDSETLTVNPDLSNTINKATDTPNSGAVPSNEEDTIAPDTASNNLYYSNSPQKEVIEDDIDDVDDEDDDDKYETISETTKANDNLERESLSSARKGGNESSFWFNANESFWNKLMSSNEHNSFYFLFPRPKPKETKKTIYPNGTVVIETTETDDDDGEINSSKTVLKCGNFTCDQNL